MYTALTNATDAAAALVTPQHDEAGAIPFQDIPDWFRRNYGIKIHLSALHRWRQSGARGQILATFVIGRRRYVRPADLRTFIDAQNKPA